MIERRIETADGWIEGRMNGLLHGWKFGLMNEKSGNGKRKENDVQKKGEIMRIRERIK